MYLSAGYNKGVAARIQKPSEGCCTLVEGGVKELLEEEGYGNSEKPLKRKEFEEFAPPLLRKDT